MIDLQLSTDIITDCNHHMRRFFRCWIDGSYKGEEHYQSNCNAARDFYTDDKRARAHVIHEWCAYMAQENDCSMSTVRVHMKKAFTGGELDALNIELIDDLRDLVRDEVEG